MRLRRRYLPIVLALLASAARGQVTSAGTLLVNLDFTTAPEGPIVMMPNAGTAGGVFSPYLVTSDRTPRVARLGGEGGPAALVMDGGDMLYHFGKMSWATVTKDFQSPPPGLVGLNPTHTIEAWVLNATVPPDGETVASLGHNTGDNQAAGLMYSTSSVRGAVSHSFATTDMPWVTGGGAPAAATWHHLVYTFDGTTSRVYSDGALRNTNVAGLGVLNLPAFGTILVGATLQTSGGFNNLYNGSLAIGRLRIHDGVLTAAAVTNNYDAEKLTFNLGTGRPLIRRPKHRWSFNNTAGSANGATIPDTEGGAHALVRGTGATFNGTHLQLPGGDSATMSYVDLPNGILSTNGVSRGGSGEVTFEGWGTLRGTRAWSRWFDFGSCSAGEINAPGPGGDTTFSGLDSILLTAVLDTDNTRRRLSFANQDEVGGGVAGYLDNDYHSHSLNLPLHFAVTWNEKTGRVRAFENGILVSDMRCNLLLSNLNDLNNWLGRSNWYDDQNLEADYDEFRLYDRELSGPEIYGNHQQGPDVVNVITPDILASIDLRIPFTTFFTNAVHELKVLGTYNNIAAVDLTAHAATVYSSNNSNVVAVVAGGQLRAVGLGSAVITAQHGIRTDTQAVRVVEDAATLEHRYSFDADMTDSVGGAHGTTRFVESVDGGALVLHSGHEDAILPSGMVAGDYAVTIEAWADFNAMDAWAPLFEFGEINPANQARQYLFFSPHFSADSSRMSLTGSDPGELAHQNVDLPYALDGSGDTHVVCEFHPRSRRMRLYLDGQRVAQNTNVTARLDDLADVRCYLGRSLWNSSAYFRGSIHEFRIHDGVLTPQRVALHHAAGPDAVPPANPGAVLAVNLSGPATLRLNQSASVRLLGDFADVSGVRLEPFGPISYTSSDTNVLRLAANGDLFTLRPGTATITGTFGTLVDTLAITVSRAAPLTLAHRYSFSGDCTDSIGGAHGSLTNQTGQAHYAAGQLVLGNTGTQTPNASDGDYVNLPNHLARDLHVDATFEVWTTWQGPATSNWQRIFDFGNSDRGEDLSSLNASDSGDIDQYYLSMATRGTGPDPLTFLYRAYGTTFETRRLEHGAPMPVGIQKHLVAVISGSTTQALFYVDGVLAERKPLHLPIFWLNDVNNWLGRSQHNDPLYVGSYDEFRLYRGAFGPDDVAASFQAGPNPGPGQWFNQPLVIAPTTNDTLRLSWPADQGDYVLQYADELAWGFDDVWWAAPAQESGEWVVYDTPPSLYRYYRLRRGP